MYNLDVKERAAGVTGITLDDKARTTWLYTKSMSADVKDMLDLPIVTGFAQHHAEGTLSLVQ